MNTTSHKTLGTMLRAFMLLSVFVPAALHAQAGASSVLLPLMVTNNHGQTTTLIAGVHELASKGLDAPLGEVELPPMPPSEIYDARFIGPSADIVLGEGSLVDLRPWPGNGASVTLTYKISHQAGRTWPSVTLHMPATFSTQITQVRVDGKKANPGDSIVTATAQGDLTIAIDFNISPVTISITPALLTFPMSNRDTTLPAPKTVHITPNVAGASWYAYATEGWIDLDRASGTGTGDIAISINALNFTDGRTSGEVHILHTHDSDPVIVTVNVDMVTAAGALPVAGDFSVGTVWPNPASIATGGYAALVYSLSSAATVSLRVYDGLGRLVRVLVHAGRSEAGEHIAQWDLRDQRGGVVSPGVYHCLVDIGGRAISTTVSVR